MVNGIDAEKEALQSLVRSCLLELNKLKFDLTQLEVEKANDNSASRIRELEQDIVDKEKEVYQTIINSLSKEEVNAFIEEGELPKSISKIVNIDPLTMKFMSKNYKDIVIGDIYDIADLTFTTTDEE